MLGEQVAPSDVKIPVYHVATKEDHIAPAASVFRGVQMLSNAENRFVLSGSGHIAGVVNPPAAGKYQYWTGETAEKEDLADWLDAATETEGSGWGDWDNWLKKRSGKKVMAREAGAVLGVLEDAPGSFVLDRFDLR
jgi:polyhydroxyalkanoate synthase